MNSIGLGFFIEETIAAILNKDKFLPQTPQAVKLTTVMLFCYEEMMLRVLSGSICKNHFYQLSVMNEKSQSVLCTVSV